MFFSSILFYLTFAFNVSFAVLHWVEVDVTEKERKVNYNTLLTTSSLQASESMTSSSASPLSIQPQPKLQHQQQLDQQELLQHHQQQQQHEKPQILKKQPMSAAERSATKKSLIILAGIFITSLAAMFYVYLIFPQLDE